MNKDISIFMPIKLNSQRIKNKSIIDVMGRPMFCWSLETLDKIGIPIYIYTNNELEIKTKIDFKTKNVSFLQRPLHLDSHETKGIEIYKEFAKQVNSDIYLLVHCTSPFVTLETYKKTIEAVSSGEYDSACTVEKKQTFCWYDGSPINFSIPRPKTQEITPVYVETSAAYCYTNETLNSGSRSGKKHKLILSVGLETLDIDEEIDLELITNIRRK